MPIEWFASADRRAVRAIWASALAPEQTQVTLAHIMRSADTNLHGTVHGGVVMKLVDDAAAAAAARHAEAWPSLCRSTG